MAWTIPAARMKVRKVHRVPLTERALEIVRAIPRDEKDVYLFPGLRSGSSVERCCLACPASPDGVYGHHDARLQGHVPHLGG